MGSMRMAEEYADRALRCVGTCRKIAERFPDDSEGRGAATICGDAIGDRSQPDGDPT